MPPEGTGIPSVMRTRQLVSGDRRVLVVVPDKGEEAVGACAAAAADHGITAAQVTAVGGFESAVLGYFDRVRREYERIPVNSQAEVLSLLGAIATHDGRLEPHLHAVLGRRDGATIGGHLLSGMVWPTLELIITEVGPELGRRWDPESGLALIDPTV